MAGNERPDEPPGASIGDVSHGRQPGAGGVPAPIAPARPPMPVTRGFLFADLRGYTAFVEANGDVVAARLLDVYRRLVREVVRRHDGAEIRTEGDSFYVVLPSAGASVRCALDIVGAAAAATGEDPALPILVGVGVHVGETSETPEGYVGSAVNLAARVCGQAAAGEVLVTDTVRSLVRTSGEFTFAPRGQPRLKGIAEPVTLYAASFAGAVTGGGGVGRPRMTPASRMSRSAWGRPLAIGGGVVVVLLAAVAIAAGTGALRTPGPDPSTVTSAAAITDPPGAWVLLSPGDAFTGGTVSGIGAGGDGFLIVGSSGEAREAAAWDTPSGTEGSWSRISLGALFADAILAGFASPESKANLRFAVVGQACAAGPTTCRASAWSSDNPDDPSAWRSAAVEVAGDPAGSRIAGVGVGPRGFIAVGSTGTGGNRRAAVWTSPDGSAWQLAPTTGDPLSPDLAAVAGGDSGLLAVGASGSDGAVWRSPDGVRWAALQVSGTFADVRLVSVTRTLKGFVTVGNGPGGAGAWYSADGATWAPMTSLPHLDQVTLTSVAWSSESGLVIVGNGPGGVVIVHTVFVR